MRVCKRTIVETQIHNLPKLFGALFKLEVQATIGSIVTHSLNLKSKSQSHLNVQIFPLYIREKQNQTKNTTLYQLNKE